MFQQPKGASEGFTDAERQAWLDAKRTREGRNQGFAPAHPAAVCVHCQRPFGITEGISTAEVALCDVCAGD